MNSTETKRKPGRPSREVVADSVAEPELDINIQRIEPNTRPCHRCGLALERSTTLLRAYDAVLLRCTACRHTSIEGDEKWFDIDTARSGNPPMIAVRASALYLDRHKSQGLPSVDANGIDAAINSEWGDARWNEYER